jgi:hypothetical protein
LVIIGLSYREGTDASNMSLPYRNASKSSDD